jgi:hypothetical protein
MFIKLSVLSIALLSGFGCAFPPAPVNNPAAVTQTTTPYVFDKDKARDIADTMVNALIKNDRTVIFSKMEKAAREYYDQATFNDVIDKMVGMFGSPIEAKFKKAAQGRRWGEGGYDKPMLKHWYAVRTSKFDYGSHFIFVEIVPDGDGYASSGISIVNFPMGLPEDMK